MCAINSERKKKIFTEHLYVRLLYIHAFCFQDGWSV